MGIRDLRAEAATVMRRAAAGERIVVTVAGRPMAQVGPLDPGQGSLTCADLVDRGALIAPRRGDRPAPTDPVPGTTTTRLDRLLRDLR